MRLTCACVIYCIFNKNCFYLLLDNAYFLNRNKFFSFSLFPRKSHVILIACVLCHQISSGEDLTKEQEDILEKVFPMLFKTKMVCQKLKCKADSKKIGKSGLNMQAVLQIFSKPPEILPARGLRLDKKKQTVNVFMQKVIPRSVSLIWSSEK